MPLQLNRALAVAERRQAEAQAAMNSLEKFVGRYDNYWETMEYEAELDTLQWRMEMFFTSITLLLDVADLPIMANDFLKHAKIVRTEFKKYEHSSYEPGDIGSPSLYYCSRALETIREVAGEPLSGVEQKRDILENIIINTPNLLFDRGIEPNNEAEVRAGMFDILKAAFPDMKREVSMPKPTKTYKMDMGSSELGVGIEYKFATSEVALKAEIGEVYADMKGYAGDERYEHFHSVFCATGPFISQARILSEFALVEAKNWTPHVLHVVGGELTPRPTRRKPRTARKGRKESGLSEKRQ